MAFSLTASLIRAWGIFHIYGMCEIITSNFKAVDVFVDAAGKHWAIPDILWASRLVSIFHASQPDCLGQSLRPSRTLPETGSSGYSERVMGYSDTLGLWKSSRQLAHN
jgi:hypothetical protein